MNNNKTRRNIAEYGWCASVVTSPKTYTYKEPEEKKNNKKIATKVKERRAGTGGKTRLELKFAVWARVSEDYLYSQLIRARYSQDCRGLSVSSFSWVALRCLEASEFLLDSIRIRIKAVWKLGREEYGAHPFVTRRCDVCSNETQTRRQNFIHLS